MSADAHSSTPRLGTWAQAGEVVGLVAAVDGDEVTLFHPGQRVTTRAPSSELTELPAGAVRVTATVELPLPHGMEEPDVRRWLASLLDHVVRGRAHEALVSAGLDEGALLPDIRVDVVAARDVGAVCLCGKRVPAPDGASLACPSCGRQAVSGPPPGGA